MKDSDLEADGTLLMSWLRICFLSALALATACAGAVHAGGLAQPNTGLAFGSFDTSSSEVRVTHVVLMRIKPAKVYMGSSGERKTVTMPNGDFYSANLAPGTYSVMGFYSGDVFFALEKSLRMNTFQVMASRAAYAGSYKLAVEKGGLFRRHKGSFARVDSPEEEHRLLDWLSKDAGATRFRTDPNAGE